MLDRVVVEKALGGTDWVNAAASLLASASPTFDDENERWRLRAIAACAQVLGQGATGRDAAAQIRELVRLAGGHIHMSAGLLQGIDRMLFADFALTQRAVASGRVLLELSPVHPVFETIPDLRWALPIDPRLRRNTHPEPASSFLRRLSPYFRFASDGQKVALHAVMMMPAGATLVAVLPTGWGKSALFQIGVRRWRETDATACVVVIVPTVALAQDHARTLASIPSLAGSRALVSGMKPSVRHETLEAFSMGDVPILLMSPEMAFGNAFDLLCEAATRGGQGHDGGHLAAVVVDEAHIIASWGRHFRPDFQRLPGFVQDLRNRQPGLRTLLLSATIDDRLRQQLKVDFSGTGSTEEIVVAEPRDEFDFAWSHLPPGLDRTKLVLQAADVIPRPAIIYTTTVEDAYKLHAQLREREYERLDLFTGEVDDPAERQQVLDSWARGETDLVVATSAFGMGVDKANVRAIVHACLPESAERLYQEIGRGGRDGHQALSLCLWTDGDASTAASLAIHGWMRPETYILRWKAILREASSKGYFSHSPSGALRLKVPLDARHDGFVDRVTGRLNRQWNAALLTLLQRSQALRIIGEEQTPSGAELWLAEVLRPEIVGEGADTDEILVSYLSLGEDEAKAARNKAAELERALLNEEEGCSRTLLFDMVEPSGFPWPCGRCSVCVAVDERPRTRPNRHDFHVAWPDRAWLRPCPIGGGSLVVNPEEPTLVPHIDRLVGRLAGIGIEQFVTTTETLAAIEQSVCDANIDLGFTLLLGGDVPPVRVPTAVLVGSRAQEPETVRRHCLDLRKRFETHWPELPLIFVLSPDLSGVGATLSQHLSSQAPMAEQELTRRGRNT
jgi:ATP-dependent DNA helicase RecQ